MEAGEIIDFLESSTSEKIHVSQKWGKGQLRELLPSEREWQGSDLDYHIGNRGAKIRIETCADPNFQDIYEKRLLGSFFVPSTEPVLVLPIYGGEMGFLKGPRIIYVDAAGIWNDFDGNIIAVAQKQRAPQEITHMCFSYTPEFEITSIEGYDYSWVNKINEVGDLYRNPFTVDIDPRMKFLEPGPGEVYWGKYLYYHKDIMAAIKIEGFWFKVSLRNFLHNMAEGLAPKELLDEWNIYQNVTQ